MALLVEQTLDFLFNEDECTNSIKNEGYGKKVEPKDGKTFTKEELAKLLNCKEDDIACAVLKHTKDYMPTDYVESNYLVFNKNGFDANKRRTEHIVERDGYETDEYNAVMCGDQSNRLVIKLLRHYEFTERYAKELYLNALCGDNYKRYNISGSVLFCTESETNVTPIRSKLFDSVLKANYEDWMDNGKVDEDINDAE